MTEDTPSVPDAGLSAERKLAALLNAFPDVGFIIDEEGRYVDVLYSPESEVLLYDDPEALVGRRIPDIFSDEKAAQFVAVIRDAIESGSLQTHEYTLDVNGTSRHFEGRVHPVQLDSESPEYVVWVGRDITERERYRQALEQERSYLQEMLDVIDDLFYVIDPRGDLVDWNQSVVEVSGYSDAELASMRAVELLSRDAVETLTAVGQEMRDSGGGSEAEAELVTKDGREIPYEFVAGVYEGASGEPLIVGIGRDVSERKQHEEALREQSELIDSMLESIDDVFYLVDAEGRALRWNESLPEVTGYSDDEIATMDALDFFEGEDRDAVREAIRDCFETGEARVRASYTTKRGERIPHEFVANTFTMPDGAVVLCGIGRDVTERDEREQQVRVFGRVLRHNLRNKMTVIKGGAEYLRDRVDDDLVEDVDQIERASDDLLDVTEKAHDIHNLLLKPSRVEDVHLDEVVESIVDNCRTQWPDAHIEVAGDTDLRVKALPQIHRALVELVENALQHNDAETPRIEIELTRWPNTVSIRVADNGPGIPEHEANVITEEREMTPLYHGEGLGLWLVRWVVVRSRGTISYRERTPRGSIVDIELRRVTRDHVRAELE